MKIVVVENEQIWIERLKEILLSFWGENVDIDIYHSGEQFLKNARPYDIIFMDVEMDGIDGFETISEYRKKFEDGLVIILTTHIELWSRGYKVEAFRYLNKAELDSIKEAMEDALKKLRFHRNRTFHMVMSGDINIDIRDILYMETCKRNVLVHTKQECFECTESIKELAEELAQEGFFYIHRSYIVNMDYVKNYNNKELQMDNGETILVSSRRYAEFKSAFMKWKFDGGNG